MSLLIIVASPISYSQEPTYKSSTLANIKTNRYADGELVFFSLVIDTYALGEVDAVVKDSYYYIDFEDLVLSANFMIKKEVVAGDKRFSGWWSNPKNTIELLFTADNAALKSISADAVAKLILKGETSTLTQDQLVDIAGTLYIRADLLANWFSASFEFNEEKLFLEAHTTVPWPFQLSQQRQNAKKNQLRKIPEAEQPHYDAGYATLSPQTIDFQTTARANQIQSGNSNNTLSYNLLGRNDIFGLSSRYYLSGNNGDLLSQARADFSRYWMGDDAGPLGITKFQFGDIQAVRTGATSSSANRGLTLGNVNLDKKTNQEFTNISGFVQSGWDIELYQNKVLVEQRFDVQNGLYEFLDLPLFAGLNEFEVVKYGPQGQIIRERFERVLDSTLNNDSKASYQVSLTQNNQSLFNIQEVAPDIDKNLAFSGLYSVGLGESSTLSLSHLNQLGTSSISDQYSVDYATRLGTTSIFNAKYTYLESASQSINLSLRTSFWKQLVFSSVNLIQSMNDDFSEDIAGSSQIVISGNLFTTPNNSLFHRSEAQVQRTLNGDTTYSVRNRLAYNTKWYGLNHSIDFRKEKDSFGNVENFTFGSVNANFNVGDVIARTGGSYRLGDNGQWDSVFFNANWYAFQRLSLRAEFVRNLQDKANSYGLGLDWQNDLYSLTARIDHSDVFDTSISLSARISFAEAPTEFGYIQSKRSLAENGTVLVRVYHDVNSNRIYDGDDIPINNAKVSATQSRRFTKTDIIGIAQLDGLTSFRKTDLVVDLQSLDNSFLVHSTQQTSVTPRSGLVTLVNYPLIEGGEIEGEVTFVDEYDRIQYVANAPLVIKDSSGTQINQTKAGMDGYFYLPGLVPHKYFLTVSDDFLLRNNFETHNAMPLVISKQGQQLLNIQLTLTKKKNIEGYVAVIGDFENEQALTIYYSLIAKSLISSPLSTAIKPFKIELSGRKLGLGLLFSKNKAAADDVCEQVKTTIRGCSVRNHTIFL